MSKEQALKIGQLAALTGSSVSTIRYYEEIGVLPPAKRLDNGYRFYDATDVERLLFVQRARALDFSLDEIGEVLELRERGTYPCGYVLNQIDMKLAEVERRIAALRKLQSELSHLRQVAGEPVGGSTESRARVCRIIEHNQPFIV